jgi:uncharacterized membrane protein
MRRTPVRRFWFLAYGLVGWTTDSVSVWAHTGRRRPSSLLNTPVYGLALPFFEPVHDRLRGRSPLLRAMTYGGGTLAVEYASGRLLRALIGHAPWDYGDARFAVDGLVRLDYFPLWAAYGLGPSALHAFLAPARRLRRVLALPRSRRRSRLRRMEADRHR